MDLLILGGTGFLGRHLVEAALGDGHWPTLFNRGLTFRPLSETIEDVLDWDRATTREEILLPVLGPRGSRSCSGPGTVSPCRMRVAK
jgi:nucleoside-diphosphate-sugar epimerase